MGSLMPSMGSSLALYLLSFNFCKQHRKAGVPLKAFLILLVFIGGMTSLALEMCASRLLGAYFGSSLYIWAVLIGLILIYLTLGYFLGGRLADRYPSERVLCSITAIAALATSLIPFVSQSILSWSVQAIEQVSVSAFL